MVECRGWVNFPVNDPRWRNTNEGGMFVKLVVVPEEHTRWEEVCCGAYVRDLQVECLIADDQRPRPPIAFEKDEDLEQWLTRHDGWMEYHYPYINKPWRDNLSDVHRHVSIPYLAAIVIGATSWSGWDDQAEKNWECTLDDLTPEGRQLYDMLTRLYPNCRLHLLTFLST